MMITLNLNPYKKPSAQPPGKVSFGCRLMAFIKSGSVTQEDDEFRRSSLSDDNNSLKMQSLKRPLKDGQKEPFNFEDLYGFNRNYGNPDGWGILTYTQKSALPVKEQGINPAYADANYNSAVAGVIKSKPNIIFAHIRLASDECKQIELSNVHPFSYQNWSFMHNGTVNGSFSPVIKAKIEDYKALLGDGPKGTTDSEIAFYYFLGKLKEANGTTDSKQLPLEKVQAAFAVAIYDLVSNSKPLYKTLNGNVAGIQGTLKTQPGCNFVLSDGEKILAFRKESDLFLGEKTLADGQKEYVIASERNRLNDKTLKWVEIPENYMLTISKDDAGVLIPRLNHISEFIRDKSIF